MQVIPFNDRVRCQGGRSACITWDGYAKGWVSFLHSLFWVMVASLVPGVNTVDLYLGA